MPDADAQLQAALADRYRIERELGRGGMATVYLAQDLRHDRPVALKLLHPDLAASLGNDRFQREIRLAARLQHPHILTVYDSGEAAGRLWFTMPYVEGESLRGRLARERQLPVEDAIRIAREAAQALQYAHDHQVIHRDIKPENLLLTRDGNTLVADFGIARGVSGSAESRLTETGLAVGTPAYMSPEQASGDRGLDARSDLYSLAAVLYEMLAGQPPFSGATTQAMLARRFTEPAPSARALRPSVPEPVDQAIRKALSAVPADRFSTMAEFGQALVGVVSTPTPTLVTAPESPRSAPPPPSTESVVERRTPRRAPLAAVLVLGILIGLGVLFAWRRGQGGDGAPGGSRVLAVLPFENLGDSADAYFADGVTDEVRTKLAKVGGLDVIARGSSNEYRGTQKRAQEIAQELGASYLLTGTVRWIKGSDGTNRVRVTPELVEVQPGQTPRTRWGEQFDAGITDVFEVQAEIAGKVVSALDVALADSVREALISKPTQNVAAYDVFLKGEAAATGSNADQRRAIAHYQDAIRLDSSFVLAWAHLARVGSFLYVNTGSSPEIGAMVRTAAERARRLAPNHPDTYVALASAEAYVGGNAERALRIAEEGLRVAPNNSYLLASAASQEQTLGRFEAAIARLERAFAIDPRSAVISRRLGYALMVLRRYPEARVAFERGLTLAPGNLTIEQNMALAALGQGDVDAVRRIADRPSGGINPDLMIAHLSQFEELYWALTDEQRERALELGPEVFEDDRAAWATVRAHLYWLRGEKPKARAWADSARVVFEEQLREAGEDAQYLAIHGVTLAYLGRHADAIREGKRALELLPPSKDMYFGPYIQHQLVRIYLLAGDHDAALDQLEPLLGMPYTLTPAWLRVDPMFEPIRKHPRFVKLVEGSA
jgi:eukaryotic-like serine/threonine-protein kinase